uniref:Ig-like domain-containing protein n=1 Tax=Oncorhynchus tshawytscha TaxID=74940 RepID=A0AAZ3Q5M6_ONCTS
MSLATTFLFFAIHLACIRAGNSSETFVKLECNEEYHGVYGQQSLLQCNVKAVENVTILTVTWKRVEADPLLLEFHKDTSNLTPGFKFAEPSWNKDNMNVSLLLTKTKMADKGVYECMVTTDRGDDTATTSLSVTGGQQTGLIWWFDQDGYNWTHRTELVAKETDDGLFSLSSKFTVQKATSSYTNYTCKVLNSNGAEEGVASFVIQLAPQVSEINADHLDSDSTTHWLAPVVVIGSLVIGLLAALLIFKRRSALRDHQPDTRHDGDVEAEGLNSDSPQDQRDSF